jgi:uncharacterized protein with HEPN domain
MLDNARAVAEIVAGKSLAEFDRDRTLRLATERALEIVGEAARHVSQAFQDAHPGVPGAGSSASAICSPMNTARS